MPYAYNTPGYQQYLNEKGVRRDAIGRLEDFATDEIRDVRNDIETSGFQDSIFDTASQRWAGRSANQARRAAKRQADMAEATFRRRTEGAALTDRQKKAATSTLGLNRAVTMADAATGSRRNSYEASRIAARAGGGFSDILFGQQLSAETGLANAGGQKMVIDAQNKYQERASRNNMIGTVAGIGIGLLSLSSEAAKAATEKSPRLLDKLKDVRIDKWKYHGGDRDHIGPYAEEFNNTFGVGKNHQSYLDVIDVLGVTLGSIKELNRKVESLGT